MEQEPTNFEALFPHNAKRPTLAFNLAVHGMTADQLPDHCR